MCVPSRIRHLSGFDALPQDMDPSKGRIGILLSEKGAANPYTLWLSHIFMDGLRARGLAGEVQILREGKDDPLTAVCSGGVFSSQVKAVISLVPFEMPVWFERPAEMLPVLFFSVMTETCRPLVAVDVEQGYYGLTKRVIRAGHKKIAFFADAGKEPSLTGLYRSGQRRAMNECGLVSVEYVVSQSGKKSVAMKFKELLEEGEFTAIVCGSLALVQELFTLPEFQKSVLSKISVVSIGSNRLPGDDERFTTGVAVNFDCLTQVCFEALNEMMNTGDCRRIMTLIVPDFVAGSTLKALHGSKGALAALRNGAVRHAGSAYSAKNHAAAMHG